MVLAAMPAIVYREHLDLFNKYKVDTIPYGKVLLALSLTLVLSITASLVFTNANNKQVTPVNEHSSYFQSAANSYYKSKQSVDELRQTLQVAGVKTQKIDTLREASASSRVPGFFTTLGDIQKTIDQINLSRENIANERKVLEGANPPELYQTLDAQMIAYMLQAESFLSKMENSQMALKNLITAATPPFFLPTLSDEAVWQRGNIEEIKAYYQARKDEAANTLENFSKVNAEGQLKSYKDLQTSHIVLVENVSENILSVLGRPAETDDEKLKLVEEAYQILVGAQRENEALAEQLEQERINLSSLSDYWADLVSLANRERTIESGLVDGNNINREIQSKTEKNESFINKVNFSGFTK